MTATPRTEPPAAPPTGGEADRPAGGRPLDQRFGKRLRVRARRDYLAVQRGGRRVGLKHFVVYGRGNGGRTARLGITVSRKVGKAVVRNRVKRWLREAFRRNLARLPGGVDLVFVARPEAPAQAYAAVEAELLEAVNRLRSAPSAARRRNERSAQTAGGGPSAGNGPRPGSKGGGAASGGAATQRPGSAGPGAQRSGARGPGSAGPGAQRPGQGGPGDRRPEAGAAGAPRPTPDRGRPPEPR